jgi:hypothetical protein
VGSDPAQDVAALSIDRGSLPIAELSEAPPAQLTPIAVAGYGDSARAYFSVRPEIQPRVVSGEIVALPAGGLRIEHSAPTTPGFSGGPVYSQQTGLVLGITQGALKGANGANTAINLDAIKADLAEWKVRPTYRSAVSASSATPAPGGGMYASARRVVFGVTFSFNHGADIRRDKIGQLGSNTEQQSSQLTSRGSIIADILGETGNKDLIIDVGEEVGDRRSPVVRTSVSAGGAVSVPSGSTLSQEQLLVLFCIGQNVVVSPQRDLRVGAAWRVSQASRDLTLDVGFRVETVDSSDVYGLRFDGTFETRGIGADRGFVRGIMTYDARYLMPQVVRLQTSVSADGLEHIESREADVNLVLVDDSFRR